MSDPAMDDAAPLAVKRLAPAKAPAREAVSTRGVPRAVKVDHKLVIFGRHDGGDPLAVLAPKGLVRFDAPNLFFGGVNLVHMNAEGRVMGAGDSRRGGVFRLP